MNLILFLLQKSLFFFVLKTELRRPDIPCFFLFQYFISTIAVSSRRKGAYVKYYLTYAVIPTCGYVTKHIPALNKSNINSDNK